MDAYRDMDCRIPNELRRKILGFGDLSLTLTAVMPPTPALAVKIDLSDYIQPGISCIKPANPQPKAADVNGNANWAGHSGLSSVCRRRRDKGGRDIATGLSGLQVPARSAYDLADVSLLLK